MADENKSAAALAERLERHLDMFRDRYSPMVTDDVAAAIAFLRRESARKLMLKQADEIEEEMRRLQADPATTVEQMRLFMQTPMPCGHAIGNLLTCPTPPFGCVICGEPNVLPPAPSPASRGEK